MASTIRIKRSSTAGNPSTLGAGELAYSALADNGTNGGDRLYIGVGTETDGNAANHIVIGGKVFTDRLDHTPGTLTASSALIVDSNSKIDTLLTTNLQLGGTGYDNYIRSTNADGNIILSPNGDGYVQITGTNALVIPKGTSAQQAPTVAGAIRFNTDNTSYEGYDGSNWSSLGGVRSIDQLTYVAALRDADNGKIAINAKDGSSSVEVVRIDKTGINIEATTATTSDGTTGALKVAGGASIQGNLYVDGALYGIDNITSNGYLAAEGVPNNGNTGYSFQNDGGLDTGMFSTQDGNLRLYSNNDVILELQGTTTAGFGADRLTFYRGSAQLGWNEDSDGIKFDTWGYPHNAIRATPVTEGQGFLIQTSNTAGNAEAGRSSLRWHDYDVSKYSQVDAQYDGIWIKNADWNGSSTVAQYWHFATNGRLTLPDTSNTGSQYNSYAQLYAQNNNEIVLNPDSDNDASRLHIASWFQNQNINVYNDGGQGLTLGNADSGDSLIDIGGSNGSWYDSPDDISIWAKRNGILHLRTNNNDIILQNDYSSVTFRNSDGHLVIPGTIETTSSTGDVILIASDGTNKALVFKQDGYVSLPNTGLQFFNSNNIGGSQIGEVTWQSNDLLIDSYNGDVRISAQDTVEWAFKYNSNNPYLQLPGGQLYTYNGNVVLGNNAQIEVITTETGRVVLGSYNSQQTGQGDYAIAVGYDAGQTNQSNHSIAIGYQAAQNAQGYKSVAIGDNAGNDSQGFLSVAIGANAGLISQSNSAVAVGHSAGRVSQSADATAIGNIAGENNQGFGAVAVGQRAGENDQGQNSVAIGSYAGSTSQGQNAVAIGRNAGQTNQSLTSIAIGEEAADTNQGFSAIALGRWAGSQYQGQKAIAIGRLAGRYNQGGWAVAIGHHAGMGVFDNTSQGTNAIAIGAHAGEYSQAANSIVIQATANGNGSGINPSEAGLYIDPIRNVIGSQYLTYNSDTKEVTYQTSTLQISGDTLSSTETNGNIVIEPNGTGHISASNAQIKNVAEPTDDTDAATKYYVDAARSGLDVKQSVRLATTEDITLFGEQTIDTKMALNGERVLVKDQDTASENGIYVVVSSGPWVRAADFDTNTEVTSGAFTFVEDGSVNINAGFVVTTKVVDVGTTAIDWTLFSASGTLIAGDGLSKSGYTLAVNVDADGGIEINSDSLRLKSSVAGSGLTYDTGAISVGGTTDRITVNSDSVDIASTYVGQSSITTLGTITTGIWNSDVIGSTYGGTGLSSYAKGDLIYASGTNTLSKLSAGDSGKVLQINGAGVPVWGDIDGGTY
jgi:hypothetical protein